MQSLRPRARSLLLFRAYERVVKIFGVVNFNNWEAEEDRS